MRLTEDPGTDAKEYLMLLHMQRLVCRLYVHLVRMTDIEDFIATTVKRETKPRERIDRERTIRALAAADEEAAIVAAYQLRRWIMMARKEKLVPRTFGKSFSKLQGVEAVRDRRQHYEDYHE